MRRATSVLAVLPLVRGWLQPAGRLVMRPAGLNRLAVQRSRFCTAAADDADGAATDVVDDDASFEALGLSPYLLAGLRAMGIEEPTDIQRRAWPVVRSGSDTVMLDETGTGKTLAYCLPILQVPLAKYIHPTHCVQHHRGVHAHIRVRVGCDRRHTGTRCEGREGI